VYSLGDVKAEPLNTQIDKTRTITIEFDANAHGLPWRFKPVVNHIEVHPGELATVEYEVVNERREAVTGQAVPSYGPERAAEYFRKIECFCFSQQTLAPGETRRMPVVFVVDPKLPKDVTNIALSYTFFEVAGRGGKS
ncbi:MAG: cytochrome c oxidase assembly protein, partial [Betaproteobacteria bacterium]|nr:cytochrome c oxidase assembly protein [Betaproteobacteria bacterium]